MRKELVLWLFFLLACLGAGFLKGASSGDAGLSFFGEPAEVEILLTDEIFLPAPIRVELERKLNIKIKILVIHDREEFNIRSITSPGYHLALVPNHWIHPATLAHQLSNLNPLKDLLSERISADFFSNSQDKIYGAPVYWMVTHLYQSAGSPSAKADPVFYFLNDWDGLTTKGSELSLPSGRIRPWEFFRAQPSSTPSGFIFELSHLEDVHEKKLAPSQESFTSLYQWSFCTPRHSPSRKITLKLLEALTEGSLQKKMILELPVASSLKTLDGESIPLNKKSTYLRDMDLSHLRKPKILSLEELKQIKIEYSTH